MVANATEAVSPNPSFQVKFTTHPIALLAVTSMHRMLHKNRALVPENRHHPTCLISKQWSILQSVACPSKKTRKNENSASNSCARLKIGKTERLGRVSSTYDSNESPASYQFRVAAPRSAALGRHRRNQTASWRTHRNVDYAKLAIDAKPASGDRDRTQPFHPPIDR